MKKLMIVLYTLLMSSVCFAYVPVPYTHHHTHKGELIMQSYYDSGQKTIRGKDLIDYDTFSGIAVLNGLNVFIDGDYVKCYEDKTYTISTITATYRYNECGHYRERTDIIKSIREATVEEEHQLSMVENTPLFKVYDPIKGDYKVTVRSFMTDFCSIALVILIITMIILVIFMVIYVIVGWVRGC